jgi:hypothetical protein
VKLRHVRHPRVAAVAALTLVALGAPAIAPAAKPVKPAIGKVTVTGAKLTVRGRVALPEDTAAVRKRVRVLVTVSDAAGRSETFKAARIDASRAWKASRTTALTGALRLTARVAIAGKVTGKRAKAAATVTPSSGVLKGTLRLDPGAAPTGAPPTGSYFRMVQPNGATLQNSSSPSANKDVTPLTPGSDGGLRTDAYQAPPSPAFAGGTSGGALAAKIIQPVPFFGIKFSVVTAPTDPQAKVADPLPAIAFADGKLSGQLTAWAAQWNGQSFNQGTPKPDGTAPPPTTPLSGTYDPATGRYALDWKSLIVGGPFNGFTGVWHLEGTFATAG